MIYRHIAIEGNIGAGKTYLASKLADYFQCHLYLERFSNNVFLEKFYQSPQEFALQVELSFLLDRYELLKIRNLSEVTIADFTFSKSIIFAGINLSEDEFLLFEKLFYVLNEDVLRPDIIVYLVNDIQRLQENIQSRGRAFEQAIPDGYLQSIESAYHQYYLKSTTIPILFFDLSSVRLIDNIEMIHQLEDALNQNWSAGIHFLNAG